MYCFSNGGIQGYINNYRHLTSKTNTIRDISHPKSTASISYELFGCGNFHIKFITVILLGSTYNLISVIV